MLSNGGYLSGSTFDEGRGGNVSVTADTLEIRNSTPVSETGIFAAANAGSTGDAGNAQVDVMHSLSITGSGVISGATAASGKGGSLTVNAGNLTIDGSATPDKFTGIGVTANAGSTGNAGELQLTVDQLLSITGSGVISGATFASGKGGSLTVHAGNLTIDGATTPGKFTGIAVAANPGSAGDAGELQLTVDRFLSVTGSGVISGSTFASGKGGSLTVHAGNLTIDGATTPDKFTGVAVTANVGSTGNAGDLAVDVIGKLIINGAGNITADTFSSGRGGNLTVHAGTLVMDGSAAPDQATEITADAVDRGNGGNVRVTVDGALTILGSADISASTESLGNGGNLSVSARTLTIDGSAQPKLFTGIVTQSIPDGAIGGNAGDLTVFVNGALNILGTGQISATTFSSGRGGNINVTAPSVAIIGGSSIDADTNEAGRGGKVTLTTQSLIIDGLDSTDFTGISSDSDGLGEAGGVLVHSGSLRLVNGGQISTSAYDFGCGGDVNVLVDTSLIRDRIGSNPSGIFATSDGIGNAGEVLFQSRDLTIRAGGLISSSTTGDGNAGAIIVKAKSIDIDGQGVNVSTGVFSNARPNSTGRAGDVLVKSDSLTIKGGGEVAASTYSSGKGGDVTLQLGNLVVDGTGTTFFTGVRASSEQGATGVAGSVKIGAGQVNLSNTGKISVTASASSGGNITVSSESAIKLSNGSSITASAAENGGNIVISARDLFFLDHSSVVATAGTSLLTGAPGGSAGAGGNISVDPTFIILDHGIISANAALGRGGNIMLRADNFFSSESLLTATGSTEGTVTITAPELDLAAGLFVLPGALVDASTQLREQCARRLGLDFSSFLVIGRGGVSLGPDETLAETAPSTGKKGEKNRASRGKN